MNKFLIYSLLTAGLLVFVGASGTYAYEKLGPNGGKGFGFGKDMPAEKQGQMMEHKAEFFNMSVDELKTELESGKNFREIAEEQGIDLEQLKKQKEALRPSREEILQHQAEILGISVEELQAQLDEGTTFRELAEEKGLTQEQLQEARKAHMTEHLNSLVAEGVITQEQADQHLEMMEKKMEHMGDGERCPGAGFRGGKGLRKHKPGAGMGGMMGEVQEQ